MKKTQHIPAFSNAGRLGATNQFVIGHAPVGKDNRPPCPNPDARAKREARPQYQGIQEIAFLAD